MNKIDNNSWSLEITKHGAYILVGEFELVNLWTFQTNILFYRSYSPICSDVVIFPGYFSSVQPQYFLISVVFMRCSIFFLSTEVKFEKDLVIYVYGDRLQKHINNSLKIFPIAHLFLMSVSLIITKIPLTSLWMLLYARNFTSLNLTLCFTNQGSNLHKLVSGRSI